MLPAAARLMAPPPAVLVAPPMVSVPLVTTRLIEPAAVVFATVAVKLVELLPVT